MDKFNFQNKIRVKIRGYQNDPPKNKENYTTRLSPQL
jgi:hypothetical protein